MVRAGLEPGNSGFQVHRPNHSTTLPPQHVNERKMEGRTDLSSHKQPSFNLVYMVGIQSFGTKINIPLSDFWLISTNIISYRMCSSRKYPYPTRKVFFILTPHPLGISVPEGLWWPHYPSGISGFLKPSSLNPSEVQNAFRLRKLTTHTFTFNFFLIEATSPTLVQLFNNTSLFYLFILLLKLYPEKIEKLLKWSIFLRQQNTA